ncbi:MAG TPA: sigma 54-interacting transcriptional regulator [Terriglobia bacterium]|nr:sigma 54-interacting transcriptional regulator [Terriglobia bacterium]
MNKSMTNPTEDRFYGVSEARYEGVLRLARVLGTHRNMAHLFSALAGELSQILSFSFLGIGRYERTTNVVQVYVLDVGNAPILLPDLLPEETLTGWVYKHRKPLVIPFLEQETRFPGLKRELGNLDIRSLCAVPLNTDHGCIGCLEVGSHRAGVYDAKEIHFVTLVADIVAVSLDAARNFEALRLSQARMRLLLRVTNRLVPKLTVRDLLRAVSASLRRAMHCLSVGVVLPDSASGQLRVYAIDMLKNEPFIAEETLVPLDGSLAGWVFRTGKPWTGKLEDLPGLGLKHDPTLAYGPRARCVVPLTIHSRVIGVLGVTRHQENPFSQDDVEFLVQVAGQAAVAIENALGFREITDLKNQLAEEKLYLQDEIRTEQGFKNIVGQSEALRAVLRQVETVARTDSTVLISGETGTGKELVARAIHDLSSRCRSPFVKLNCAAIPAGLLESELFGHEKGAFTGAIAQHVGRFEVASRGSVFLDEVGEIPLELQPKLLRVLQDREFERLGSTRTMRTEARLIAATNRDLALMAQEGKFRSDLFYRLNVFPVCVPPLRERPEDIPLLVRHFVHEFSRHMNKKVETIAAPTMDALVRYHWPGNIRELQNVVERAVILSNGPVFSVPLADLIPRQAAANSKQPGTLEEVEKEHILKVLAESNWVLSGPQGAAARLGMNRSTLYFRMRKLGISRPVK